MSHEDNMRPDRALIFYEISLNYRKFYISFTSLYLVSKVMDFFRRDKRCIDVITTRIVVTNSLKDKSEMVRNNSKR